MYRLLRLWTNHWQPSLKLIGKSATAPRCASATTPAGTPYRRVLATHTLDPAAIGSLAATHAEHGPVALKRALDQAVTAFWTRRTPVGNPRSGTPSISLDNGNGGASTIMIDTHVNASDEYRPERFIHTLRCHKDLTQHGIR